MASLAQLRRSGEISAANMALNGGGDRKQVLPGRNPLVPQLNPLDNSSFTIVITRNLNGTGKALPCPLFAAGNDMNAYFNYLAQFVENGLSISGHNGISFSENMAAHISNNATISFTDGVNTDTLTISCVNTGYKLLLQKLMTDQIVVRDINYQVESANTAQFSQPVHVVQNTGYGKYEADSIVPKQYIDPYQQQPNMVIIGQSSIIKTVFPPFNQNNGLALMIAPIAGNVVTLSFSIGARYLQN